MKVAQIQQSGGNTNGIYSTRQSEVRNNPSKIVFGKDNSAKKPQAQSPEELRNTQMGLKQLIGVMLQTETDPKKIKELKNYEKVLDVLLENGKNSAENNIKNTPDVAFGSRKSDAQAAVHLFSAGSAGIAASLAQAPGVDEVALAGNDVLMAIAICKIYDLSLTKSAAKVILAPIAGNALGVKIFSKAITWFPGLGNVVNATVAGSVTEAIGHSIIAKCENGEMQKAIKKLIDKG